MRFLLVPVLVASLGAQTPEAPAVDVAGRVVDSKTHRLLSGVAIQFRASGGDNLLTESDGNGRFRFEGVAPGRYSTTALRSGYLPGRAAFDIAADEEQQIVVELDPPPSSPDAYWTTSDGPWSRRKSRSTAGTRPRDR